MKRIYWLLIILFLSIGGYVYASSIPRGDFVKSWDGKFLVEGRAEILDTIEITEFPMIPVDNLVLTVYEVSTEADLSEGVVLHYDMRDQENVENQIFYVQDEVVEMWRPLGGEMKNGILSLPVFETGYYTVGGHQEVGLLDFSEDLDEILSYAPEDTVGFLVSLAYNTQDMHNTLLDDDLFVGGCGGEFKTGDSYDASRIEKPSSVFVNGEQTDVTFIFIAQWLVGEGCGQDGRLEAGEGM